MKPKVSFVIPCYKLAHLLGECLESILSQTFTDFEVLVMDDCSPDNTGEVTASFNDPRIRYIRNEPNLGHLRNYNKGIELSRGEYVWLISADDGLRSCNVLETYISVMQRNPNVGYIFCSGIGLENSSEVGILKYSVHGSTDAIFPGSRFFLKLLTSNSVLAASAMARRECYDVHGVFPTDLPFAGDWYLWLLFALHHDVAYCPQPMVFYRQHPLSMTTVLNDKDPGICTRDDMTVLWRIKRKAQDAGRTQLARRAERAIIDRSTLFLTIHSKVMSKPSFTFDDFHNSLMAHASGLIERRRIGSRVYSLVADENFWAENLESASQYYRTSLITNPLSCRVWAKYILLGMGRLGVRIRETLRRSSRNRTATGATF